jgi:hypothetical protein
MIYQYFHNNTSENDEAGCSLVCWTILRPWRRRRYVPPKRRVQLYRLHGVISQKMILFKTTAVKTSNPTTALDFDSITHSLNIHFNIHLPSPSKSSKCLPSKNFPSENSVHICFLYSTQWSPCSTGNQGPPTGFSLLTSGTGTSVGNETPTRGQLPELDERILAWRQQILQHNINPWCNYPVYDEAISGHKEILQTCYILFSWNRPDHRLWGPPSLLSDGYRGCEADHSPQTIAEVKKKWIYASTPPWVFMV